MPVDDWLESIILSEAGEQGLTWGLMSIVFILLPLRLHLRYSRYHRLLSDDYILFPATILLIVLGAIHSYQYPILFRAHNLFTTNTPFPPDLLQNKIPSLLKTQFAKPFFVWTVQWLCKLSLLMFLRRLLRVWPTYMRWWWAALVLCTVSWLSVLMINCFTCFPPKRKWEGNTCNNPHDIAANNNGLIAATVVDIASEIAIILLPYRLFLSIKISTRHRVVVFGVFSIGIFLVFLGIWRIALLYITKRAHSLWLNGIIAAQFGQLFGTSAVIAAILPALRLFFTEEQRRNFTEEIERRKKVGAVCGGGREGTSDDITLFSTTYLHDEENSEVTRGKSVEEVTKAEASRTVNRNPTTTPTNTADNSSNLLSPLSSLRGIRSFVRGELASNTEISSSITLHGTLCINPRPQDARLNRQLQSEIYPLQVKLHQVIPDIGGETSPTIQRR